MRTIIVFLLITIISYEMRGQDVVKVKEFYAGEGVVFNERTKKPFDIKNAVKYYTPSIEDIKKAEMLINGNLSEVKYDGLVGMYEPRKIKKKLKCYNRQYLGFVNLQNDHIIFIQFLNFKNRKKAEAEFAGWKGQIIVGFGKFYETNTLRVTINLSRKEVEVF